MQQISGLSAPAAPTAAVPAQAAQSSSPLSIAGNISSSILGAHIQASETSDMTGISLSSALGGSIEALMKKNEEPEEDWMQELSQKQAKIEKEKKNFIKNLAKGDTKPGELGINIPGANNQKLKDFLA